MHLEELNEGSGVFVGKVPEFQLGNAIKMLGGGLQMMKVGGKAILFCPPLLSYRDEGGGSVPRFATLTFEVELVDIE